MSHVHSHITFRPELLRQARRNQKLTIEEAAHLSNLNKMTLLRYESGDIKTMELARLQRLARLYRISPALLIGYAPTQEFYLSGPSLHLIPLTAQTPTPIGKRLLTCLQFTAKQKADA